MTSFFIQLKQTAVGYHLILNQTACRQAGVSNNFVRRVASYTIGQLRRKNKTKFENANTSLLISQPNEKVVHS